MPTHASKPLRIFVGAAALVLGLGMMAKATLAEPTGKPAHGHDHSAHGHDHGAHDHAAHDHAGHDHAAHGHDHGSKANEKRSESGAANNNADQTKEKKDKKHKHD